MKHEFDFMLDAFMKLDHPLAHKFKELHAPFKTLSTDQAEKHLADWKKNNPEEAKELSDFLTSFEKEFKESRREVNSELGYSRVGLGNV